MTAPLLRRLTAGLLILPLLFGAGCSDDKTEKPSLTLSAEKIVLPSEAGATARLDVTASGRGNSRYRGRDSTPRPSTAAAAQPP